ncbi:hypothetical protein [Blastococcus sp. SYSU D00813]
MSTPTPSPRPPSAATDPEEAWRQRMLYVAEQNQQTLRRVAADVRTVRTILVVYAFLAVLSACAAVLLTLLAA